MPTCPGCKRQLTHDELIEHIRYCKWVWSDQPARTSQWRERLAERIRENAEESEPRR